MSTLAPKPPPPQKAQRRDWRRAIRPILNYRAGGLARGTASATIWQLFRLACNLITIIVIARTIGADGYGLLTGLAGSAVILGALVASGSGFTMLEAVAGSPTTFARHWWASLRLIGASAAALIVLYVFLLPKILDLAPALFTLISIAVSELLLYPLAQAAGFAFQAHHRIGLATAIPALMASTRLIGTFAFAAFAQTHDIAHYAHYYLVAAFIGSALSLAMSFWLLRPKRSADWYSFQEIRHGLRFSLSWFSTSAFGEIDKLSAVRLAGAEVAGIYGAAYRLITVLAVPISSLSLAVQPRIFKFSQLGPARELTRTIRVVAISACFYGLLAACLVGLIAPLIPLLLGPDFTDADRIARLLAPILFLMCVRTTAGTFLTSLGNPGQRAIAELSATTLLVMLAIALMPKHGLVGIAASVIAAETALLIALSTLVIRRIRSLN